MSTAGRLSARWQTARGELLVAEPEAAELEVAAPLLADFYNDPHNAALLCNTLLFTPESVREFWEDAATDGGRNFLLWCDGVVVGDADYRNHEGVEAELAILVGPRDRQGVGLGRAYAALLLAIGFRSLGLERVFVTIRPKNEASLRLFARAGFTRDDSPRGRYYAEDADDVCLRLDRSRWLETSAQAGTAIVLG